MQMSKQQIQLL